MADYLDLLGGEQVGNSSLRYWRCLCEVLPSNSLTIVSIDCYHRWEKVALPVLYHSSAGEGWRGERRFGGVDIGESEAETGRKDGSEQRDCFCHSSRPCDLRIPARTQLHEGALSRYGEQGKTGMTASAPRPCTAAAAAPQPRLYLNHPNTLRILACQRNLGRRSFLIGRTLLSLRVAAIYDSLDRRDVTLQHPRRHTTDLTCTAIVALLDRARCLGTLIY